MNFNFFTAFSENEIVGKFGVKYLDDELCGIMRGDFVLIGARSGAGKSSLANMIARENKKSKQTALFSLENFENDLPMEQAYRYYLHNGGQYCSMRDFASGEFMKRYRGHNDEIAGLLLNAVEKSGKMWYNIKSYLLRG